MSLAMVVQQWLRQTSSCFRGSCPGHWREGQGEHRVLRGQSAESAVGSALQDASQGSHQVPVGCTFKSLLLGLTLWGGRYRCCL